MAEKLAAIRSAIECGEFTSAAGLWEEWSRDLAARVQSGSAAQTEWAQTVELYRWARQALQCARAHAGSRLDMLHAANAYVRGA